MEKPKRTISILLTRQYDGFSQIIYNITGRGYTHASLGLEGDSGGFYSFNVRGFCEETLEKYRRHGVEISCCYQLEVTEEVYDILYQSIQRFKEHKKQYHYGYWCIIFGLLHIPFFEKNGYFCSQFVAELLNRAGVIENKKKSNLYLPNQFQWELQKLPCLRKVLYGVV